jgi:hypothetical protein
LLTPLIWLSLRGVGQELSIEGEAEGMKDADAASSGGFEDRADVGVEVGAPFGSEAVGDLAEDDAGPQRLFRPVVGGRHRAVGQEDEQGLPGALDDALQLQPWLGVRHDLEQAIERALEPGVVGGQGNIGEPPVTDTCTVQVVFVGEAGDTDFKLPGVGWSTLPMARSRDHQRRPNEVSCARPANLKARVAI